jgi:hypothetical protein
MFRTIAVLLLFVGIASAVPCNNPNTLTGVYQTTAALTGCQSGAGGLTHDPTPTAWDDFYVSLDITLSGGVYTYNYTFQDPRDAPPRKAETRRILSRSDLE